MVWIKYYPYVESFANLMQIIMLLAGGLFLIWGELTMGGYVAIAGLIWAVQNPSSNSQNVMRPAPAA